MKKFVSVLMALAISTTACVTAFAKEDCKRYPTYRFKEVKQVEEVQPPEEIEYDYVNYAYLNSNGELKITSNKATAEEHGKFVETYVAYAKQGVKHGNSGIYNEDGERTSAYTMSAAGGNPVYQGKEVVVDAENIGRFPGLQELWESVQP